MAPNTNAPAHRIARAAQGWARAGNHRRAAAEYRRAVRYIELTGLDVMTPQDMAQAAAWRMLAANHEWTADVAEAVAA